MAKKESKKKVEQQKISVSPNQIAKALKIVGKLMPQIIGAVMETEVKVAPKKKVVRKKATKKKPKKK